jgi:hypothetical protein
VATADTVRPEHREADSVFPSAPATIRKGPGNISALIIIPLRLLRWEEERKRIKITVTIPHKNNIIYVGLTDLVHSMGYNAYHSLLAIFSNAHSYHRTFALASPSACNTIHMFQSLTAFKSSNVTFPNLPWTLHLEWPNKTEKENTSQHPRLLPPTLSPRPHHHLVKCLLFTQVPCPFPPPEAQMH